MVDRFEGEYAVVETSSGMIDIPRKDLPPNAKEGDLLVIKVDARSTKTRKAYIEQLVNDVFKD